MLDKLTQCFMDAKEQTLRAEFFADAHRLYQRIAELEPKLFPAKSFMFGQKVKVQINGSKITDLVNRLEAPPK